MGAKKTIIPSDYQVDLDRIPAQPDRGCAALLMMVFVLFAVVAGGGLLYSRIASPAAPVVPTDAPGNIAMLATMENWRAVLSATPSATINYCFWLTPTETPLPTVEYVDDWSATGTAVYLATNPYQSPTPTPDVPRAWCNDQPSPTFTPTLTALKLKTDTPTPTASASPTPMPTQQPAVATVEFYNPANSGSNYAAPTFPPSSDVIPLPSPTKTKKFKPTKTPTSDFSIGHYGGGD